MYLQAGSDLSSPASADVVLDDCSRLELLRAIRPVCQFRHAELHD